MRYKKQQYKKLKYAIQPPIPIITTTNATIKIFNLVCADNTINISSEKQNQKPYIFQLCHRRCSYATYLINI